MGKSKKIVKNSAESSVQATQWPELAEEWQATGREWANWWSRAVTGGSDEQIDMSVCGQSSIQVEVRRVSGSGPFSVNVTRP